jgi:hypothetical protein
MNVDDRYTPQTIGRLSPGAVFSTTELGVCLMCKDDAGEFFVVNVKDGCTRKWSGDSVVISYPNATLKLQP